MNKTPEQIWLDDASFEADKLMSAPLPEVPPAEEFKFQEDLKKTDAWQHRQMLQHLMNGL